MKVLFVKSDSKVLSSGLNIIDELYDDRFEIGQQYAWEWSLKINEINEDDAGIYFCKVGYTTIKKYEIVVRVPPRIRDDGSGSIKSVKEGDNVQLTCLASGTPKPNITWFSISADGNSLFPLSQIGSYLTIENVSRSTPRRYQCRAANFIPPSDTKNFTLSIECKKILNNKFLQINCRFNCSIFKIIVAPEITIDSKLNDIRNTMELNCTIRAYPLTNRNFWRKDGSFLRNSIKTEIKNIRLDDFTLVSQLTIKYYNELDQGLYECTAENDLRVSKMVYTLKDTMYSSDTLTPIGYSNNFKGNSIHFGKDNSIIGIENILSTTTGFYRRRKFHKHHENQYRRKYKNLRFEDQETTTIGQILRDTTNSYNSPYIILLDDYSDDKQQRLHNAQTTTTVHNILFNRANTKASTKIGVFVPLLFIYWFKI